MKSINLEAIITSISSRQDRSLRLSMVTPELTSEERAIFMEVQGNNLNVILEPIDYNIKESLLIDKEVDRKSPSSRLRSVLYVYFKQNEDSFNYDFGEFYRRYMDKKIEDIKSKLEE